MSKWVQIVGSIYIWTRESTEEAEPFIKRYIIHAPKITGSEGNATIFVNQLAPPEGQPPSSFERRRAVITVVGELRDRTPSVTRKEWRELLKFIRTLGIVENYACKIQEDNWR